MANSREAVEASISYLIPHNLNPIQVDDDDIEFIRKKLGTHTELVEWSKKPRLYVVLRMLQNGCDNKEPVMDQPEWSRVDDYWLPMKKETLDELKAGVDTDSFLQKQYYILSKATKVMHIEQLEATKHRHKVVENGDEYFTKVGELLGEGRRSNVFKVKHDVEGSEPNYYARKLAPRGRIKDQEAMLKLFKQEWKILRRINHHHIVNLIASYTDKTSFALIMSPVAKESLKFILDRERDLGADDLLVLRQSFACLTAALVYLHDNHIRHKDIKPGNILVDKGSVYLCDFGISHDYSEQGQATTRGERYDFTTGYAAPEVDRNDPRNETSDVWSMGRVFCEIITVIKGRTVQDMVRHFGGRLTEIYDKPHLVDCWLQGLLSEHRDSPDDHPIAWAWSMIRSESKERPTARTIADQIRKRYISSSQSYPYLKDCCRNSEELSLIDRQDSRNSRGRSELPFRTMPPEDMEDLDPVGTREVPVDGSPEHSGSSKSSKTHTITPAGSSTTSPERPSSTNDLFVGNPIRNPMISACVCTSQTTATGQKETRLFDKRVISCTETREQSMHETHPQKCFSGNTLEIFESYLEGRNVDSGIWFKTRRLVISNRLNDPEICDCYSLWLPLTDIRYETYDKRVLMEWSDCNHLCEERSGDSNLIFGYKYQPKKPNNKITVEFSDAAAAKSFIAVVICADLDPRFQEKSIILPGSQELYAFVVPKHYIPKHYVVHVLTKEGDRNELKLFIHRPDARLDVETNRRVSGAGPTLSVRFCGEVSTPNYISNITGKPSVEQGTEVKCEKAELVYTGYRLESPLIESDRVPHDLKAVLTFLTGWNTCFFAAGVKVTKMNMGFAVKDYGFSNIILWESVEAHSNRDARITFRRHVSNNDYAWRSGTITASPQAKYDFPNVTITVLDKMFGHLLDTQTMRATTNIRPQAMVGKDPTAGKISSQDSTKLKLRFENINDFDSFFAILRKLQGAARSKTSMGTNVYPPSSSQSTNSKRSSFRP